MRRRDYSGKSCGSCRCSSFQSPSRFTNRRVAVPDLGSSESPVAKRSRIPHATSGRGTGACFKDPIRCCFADFEETCGRVDDLTVDSFQMRKNSKVWLIAKVLCSSAPTAFGETAPTEALE